MSRNDRLKAKQCDVILKPKEIQGSGLGMDIIKGAISLTQKYPGEKHVPGYNFLGPGTNMEERRKPENQQKGDFTPINRLDAAAKKHDIQYENIQNKYKELGDKPKAIADIHQADKEFVEELAKMHNLSMIEKVAMNAIKLKKFMEEKDVLSTEHLSGVGIKKRLTFGELHNEGKRILSDHNNDAFMSMKNEYKSYVNMDKAKKNHKKRPITGGMLPFLMPLLTMAVSTVGPIILDKIINHFSKKDTQSGKGQALDGDEKMKKVISLMSKITPQKQIEIMTKVIK